VSLKAEKESTIMARVVLWKDSLTDFHGSKLGGSHGDNQSCCYTLPAVIRQAMTREDI
jgi:hypothetical protein